MKTTLRLAGALCALAFFTNPVQAAPSSAGQSGVQLTIELRDGSRVVGKSLEDTLSLHSATLGDMNLSWAAIRSIEYAGTNTEVARLTATNGDGFAIQLASGTLRVETGFGQTELPVKLIRSVKVAPPAKPGGAAGTGTTQLTIELRDGSHVVGKSLEDALNFHTSAMGDLKLTWAGIRAIEYAGTNAEMARLTATNGDVYEVQFANSSLGVETSFGKAELPVKLIRSVKVSAMGNAGQEPTGLIGWWKLDDGNGTVAKDSSYSQPPHGGNLVNGPAWTRTPGHDEGCLEFNGANQYVSLGNIFQGSYKEISIACWVKHGTSQWQTIVERSSWGVADGIGLMMDYNTTSVTFGHYGGSFSSIVEVKSKANAQDNQWHHVAGTLAWSGSEYVYSIYVDGKLDNAATGGPVGMAPTSNPWTIGAHDQGTWAYRGLIADVRIYDRALSLSDVQAIYAERNYGEPLPPPPSAP